MSFLVTLEQAISVGNFDEATRKVVENTISSAKVQIMPYCQRELLQRNVYGITQALVTDPSILQEASTF